MMVRITIILILVFFFSAMFIISCSRISKSNQNNKKPLSSFYELTAKDISGEDILMSTFKDKKILIVNVASECGYTPQYKELQKLYDEYKNNLHILAFPSNDFLNQEPGSNKQIKNFCEVNFGIKFDIFEKISVKGNNISPIYRWLSNKSENGWNNRQPIWNFCKYLIDENGTLIGFWGPSVTPLSNEILNKIKN